MKNYRQLLILLVPYKKALYVGAFCLIIASLTNLAVPLYIKKLVDVVMPRLKDFQGVSRKKIDTQGNYTLGLSEQIIFPEVDYDKIGQVQGLEISITTSTKDPKEALALLEALGMPFEKEGKK